MGGVFSGDIRKDLTDALQRKDFERVKELAALNGLSEKELLYLARVYDAQRQNFEPEQFKIILGYCYDKKIETVFEDVVKEKLWRSTGAFMERGVDERLRHFAVRQDLSGACDSDLSVILSHCADEQYNEQFLVCVEKGLWNAVGKLLERKKKSWRKSSKRRATLEQCGRAFAEATKRASTQTPSPGATDGSQPPNSAFDGSSSSTGTIDDCDLSTILSACVVQPTLQVDCLKQAVIRGLWETVLNILTLRAAASARKNTRFRRTLAKIKRSPPPGLDSADKWALKQAAEHAEENTVLQFLSFYQKDMLEKVLEELVKRELWRAATELLLKFDEKRVLLYETRNPSSSVQTLNSSSLSLASNSFRTNAHRVDYVLEASLQKPMWGVVKALLSNGGLSSEQTHLINTTVTEAAGLPDFPLETHGPKRYLKSMLDFLATSDACNVNNNGSCTGK